VERAEGDPAPPGWHSRDIEDLPWPVLLRVAVCRGVLCMLITLLVVAFIPRAFGFTGTTVVTGSMTPVIQPGDVALVWPLDEYLPGQVILFPNPAHVEQRTIHRIVEVRADGMLVTKGDANEVADSTPVDPDTVIGVGRILIPVIGLPIVWAANGAILLVLVTVLLGALLIRGTLTVEFFPRSRKARFARAVIEASVMMAMLVVAALVVNVGLARASHAFFVDRTAASATWAMVPPPDPTETCAIENWVYQVSNKKATADFQVVNRTDEPISASPTPWQLTWRFTGDEQAEKVKGNSIAQSITQVGDTVTYIPKPSATIEPGAAVAGQVEVRSDSGTFNPPTDFFLNGLPCAFVPVPPGQELIIIDPPSPTPAADSRTSPIPPPAG